MKKPELYRQVLSLGRKLPLTEMLLDEGNDRVEASVTVVSPSTLRIVHTVNEVGGTRCFVVSRKLDQQVQIQMKTILGRLPTTMLGKKAKPPVYMFSWRN